MSNKFYEHEVTIFDSFTGKYHKAKVNRVVEEQNGYRIFDDGDCVIGHVFSIEKAIRNKNGKVIGWEAVDMGKLYDDFKPVYDRFRELVNRVGTIDPFSGLIWS